MFLVPTECDGFEAQPVWTLSGERTNITFYADVRVSDEWRIGDVEPAGKCSGSRCRTNTPQGGARTSSGCYTTPSNGHEDS